MVVVSNEDRCPDPVRAEVELRAHRVADNGFSWFKTVREDGVYEFDAVAGQ